MIAQIFKTRLCVLTVSCLGLCRLFVEVGANTPEKRRMLPLKHQQAVFESIYQKVLAGIKLPVRPADV